MHRVVCAQGQAGADGFVVAWDAQTGRERWRYEGAPFESSPLLHGNRLYVGSWDHGVHAINAKTGKRIWRFEADNEVNTSAAYWKRRIFIASDSGTLYSLNAKTGKLIWTGQQRAREFFYATPTVAYGRVYIGSTDGTMYVYGAKSGKLLWARPLGSYIYGAAAVYKRKVFVGTYDGKFYALDAATGDVRWQIDAHGAVHARTDRDERARLLRGLLELWLGGPALGGPRPGRHLRGARARRHARVALPGGQVREPGGGRQGAHVPHRPRRAYAFAKPGSDVVKEYLAEATVRKAPNALSDGAQHVERRERVAAPPEASGRGRAARAPPAPGCPAVRRRPSSGRRGCRSAAPAPMPPERLHDLRRISSGVSQTAGPV